MSSLMIVDENKIRKKAREEIDLGIKRALEGVNKSGQLALLSLRSVTALTSGKARWRELKEQGMLTHMFRTITGKNRAIRQAMEEDIFHFQYIAQQTLQELADRQCLTLDVIAAVHNKFNLLFLENDKKFEQVYTHLHAFFDYTEKNITNLNSRLIKAEKNIDLLNWHATLSVKKYSGINYIDLKDIEKIVCLTKDFFEITKGDWDTQNLLLLEDSMQRLQLEGSMNLMQFITELFSDRKLVNHLIEPIGGLSAQEDVYFDFNIFNMISELSRTVEPLGFSTDSLDKYQEICRFDKPISIRNLIYELLTELRIVQELILSSSGDNKVVYEVFLKQIENLDFRIDIVREIKQSTRLPLEVCRSIVKNIPSKVCTLESYEEAQELKSRLEQLRCRVEIY
ncbi:ribosomal protein L7/L12 [Paenibacillus hamazuiensis]|uniref:ribosomal protein L7/L12 n=1 Tax=Paenibacillus hamazuiensis TaxID=2936508 RepID=UPI00200C8685|nr:ribosomal protein L7/L12 [Paenibacillus hamazuiensis]